MSYKCPLCLRDLTPEDTLVRFCTKHSEKYEPFKCTPDNIPRVFFCPKRGCYSNFEIEQGVFLLHVGCDAKNPFWNADKKQTVIPGDNRDSTTVTATVNVGRDLKDGVEVQHWEIGMLRVVPNMYEEMWFPLMLLLATNGTDARGARLGALVELSGAASVGKTIIALQSMDYQGYVPSGMRDLSVIVKGFIYSRTPPLAAFIPMLSIMHLHTLLRLDRIGTYTPLGTRAMPGDLKAALFLPRPDAAANGNRGDSGVVSRFFQEMGGLFGGLIGKGGAVGVGSRHWYSLLFYDSAGEDVEAETMRWELRAVDKLAVFIDAQEIFSGPETSIGVAVQRISRNWTSERKPCALVVTKLDLVFGSKYRVSGQEHAVDESKIREMTQAGGPGDTSGIREMLIQWLKSDRSGTRQQLLGMLEDDRRRDGKGDSYIERVFFVWTENLSETQRGDHLQPESHGLLQLVCWCLDREWAEINQSLGAASRKA